VKVLVFLLYSIPSLLLLLYLLNPFLSYLTVSRLFFHFDHFTDGRTPWTSDQLVARPLHKQRTTQTQNKHISNIHALLGIRTHDPGFRASEDSTCLRPLGYGDRPNTIAKTRKNELYFYYKQFKIELHIRIL
jgi:hypothetical protein